MISTAGAIRTGIINALDGLGYIRTTENQVFTEISQDKLYSFSGSDLNPTSTAANLMYYFEIQNVVLIRFNIPTEGYFSAIDTIETTSKEEIHDAVTKMLHLPIRVNIKQVSADEQTAIYSITISTQYARRLT